MYKNTYVPPRRIGNFSGQSGARRANVSRCWFRFAVVLFLFVGTLLAGKALAATTPGSNDGGRRMDRSVSAEQTLLKLFGTTQTPLSETDPDFAAMRDRLIHGEIAVQGTLDDKQRELITLVVLATGQTLDGIKAHVGAALQAGATPVEIKEALYQCAPYIGFPKTEAALRLVNDAFAERRVALPVGSRSTVTEDTRYADGLKVQKGIFGGAIDTMHRNTPASQKAIMQDMLTGFCFGDVYTRKGLDLKNRELLTFSIISALGGCENQVKAHVQGNINVGNSKRNLIDALAQSLPYIGFPRTLNALACVNAVVPEEGQAK